jgi:hypothetical protein
MCEYSKCIVYMNSIQCLVGSWGGYGVLSLRQIDTCPKVRHFALPTMSLVFLRHNLKKSKLHKSMVFTSAAVQLNFGIYAYAVYKSLPETLSGRSCL